MRTRRLVAVVGLALAVELVDLTAWSGWSRMTEALEEDPDGAASWLVASPVVALPGFAQLGRQLDGGALETAAVETAVAAFDRLGRVQQRWMPTDASGPRNRSRSQRLAGRPDAALALARAALDRFPTSPFGLRLAASVELETGDRASALDHLAAAEALAGGYRLPRVELSDEESRWLRLEALRRRLHLYPRREVVSRVELARELRKRGETGEARDLLSAVEQEPEVRIELARWDLEAGDPEAGEARLLPVAGDRRLPAVLRSRALVVLAEARSDSGDEEGALASARQALRLQPGSPTPFVALARLAESRGDLQVALAHLRRAWGVAPDNISVLASLARVAAAAGAGEDARLALERAVELRPDDPGLACRLVQLHLAEGDLGAAALALSDARDRFPADACVERLRNRLQAELGPR